MDIKWLRPSMVRAVHAVVILEKFGGGRTGEDPNSGRPLESILQRIPNKYEYGEITDVLEAAAMYGTALAKGHAFVDGNKRTAFTSMAAFLALHGWTLIYTEQESNEIAEAMEKVADSIITETELYNILFEFIHLDKIPIESESKDK